MSDTKEKIIALADKLIRTKGFNAFSYKDISAPLDIRNAAVHYYFPTKADLGISVVDAEISKLLAQEQQWNGLPEDEQLKRLFDIFRKRSREGCICLMGSLSPDYDTLPEPMQQKVQEMSSAIVAWVARCLEKGRAAKRFHFEGHPYDRALLVVSNLLSSLLLSRVMGKQTFSRMSDRLLKDLL